MAYKHLLYIFSAFAVVLALLLFQTTTMVSARQECSRMRVCSGDPLECPVQLFCWEVPEPNPEPVSVKKKRHLRRRSLPIQKN